MSRFHIDAYAFGKLVEDMMIAVRRGKDDAGLLHMFRPTSMLDVANAAKEVLSKIVGPEHELVVDGWEEMTTPITIAVADSTLGVILEGELGDLA